MQAKLIEKYDDHTALYECDPPMMFIEPNHPVTPLSILKQHFSKIVIFGGDLGDGYLRTIIHAADELQGGEGHGYGASGHRMIDGINDHAKALEISGYKLAA
jgi:hypothetical protein